MKRREFIGKCAAGVAAAGVAGHAGEAVGSAGGPERIICLAAVIVPDRDRSAWTTGEPARTLADLWYEMPESRRGELRSFLDSLDREAGGSFLSLAPERRSLVLKMALDRQDAWPSGFAQARSLAVRAFYGSGIGFERTGYAPTTQFRGYPQFADYPRSRSGQ